ncbi:MAG: UDP-N-acetylglucosamine 1-carboxyvinyltransferase [Planctomycetaceae bacterium]
MDMLIVRGGRPLQGSVAVSGSKNAALPIMSAALAVDGTCRLQNVPDLADVRTLTALLGALGTSCSRLSDGALELQPASRSNCVADYDLVRRMRAGVCVLGPLLARHGYACVSLPGGCNIGHRPIDLHLKGLRALGARIQIERGYVIAEADRLTGANIYLGGPFGSTVTGTCNVLSAAVLADGVTTIEAAACEPEVVDLGRFLIAAGAQITGLGTPTIRVTGVSALSGCTYRIIPDRIEAATLVMAAAITRGRIDVTGAEPTHLTAVLELLREIGVGLEYAEATIQVDGRYRITIGRVCRTPVPGSSHGHAGAAHRVARHCGRHQPCH